MAMPDISVSLAPPDLSTWIGISPQVVMPKGIRLSRGRNSVFDNSSPGSASFTVDNREGLFTPGAGGTYDTLGLLVINAGVRFTISTDQVWQGYVDSIVCNLDDETATITASDAFKIMAKQQFGPYGVERAKVIMDSSNPTVGAVYPLTDSRQGIGDEWAAWRDTAASPIRVYAGSSGSHEFTDDKAAPYLGGSFRIFPSAAQIGPVLEHPTTFNPGGTGGLINGSIAFWFRTSTEEDMVLFRMFRTSGGSGYVQAQLNGVDGDITFDAAGDSAGSWTRTTAKKDMFDDQWHHVLLLFTDNSGTSRTSIDVYIDGTLRHADTSTGARLSIGSSDRRIVFGGIRNTAWTDNSFAMDGYLALPMVWDKGSASDAGALYSAAMDGDADESVATRLGKWAAFVDGPAWSTTFIPSGNLAGIDTTGRSYLDCVNDAMNACLGVAYVDRLGALWAVGYSAYAVSLVDETYSADADLKRDLTLSLDDSTFANTVEATSPSGTKTVEDATSVGDIGPVIDSFNCPLYTIAALEVRAGQRLDQRSTQEPRLSRVTVDVLTSPMSSTNKRDAAKLEPLKDRIQVTGLSAAVVGATTYDGFVEGWELNMSDQEFTVSLDLSPVI
jgi:hypothetical protein